MDLTKFIPVPPEVQAQRAAQSANREILKPSHTILEWEAPDRIVRHKSRQFYRVIAVTILFFALLLLIIKEFLLVAVLGVIFFGVYVFNTVPARTVRHVITNNGINYASEQLYRWSELRDFYVQDKGDHRLLVVNTVENLPGRLMLILSDEISTEKITDVVNDYISILEDPEPPAFEKINDSIASRLNI